MKPCFLLLFGLLLTTLASLSATGPAKPIILLIFADDIGYAGPHHAKDGQTFCSVARPGVIPFGYGGAHNQAVRRVAGSVIKKIHQRMCPMDHRKEVSSVAKSGKATKKDVRKIARFLS